MRNSYHTLKGCDVSCAMESKDYDYASDYDVKKGKYNPKGKLVSRELLCLVLWKCASRNKEIG